MNHHQQTLRDLENMSEPGAAEVSLYLAVMLAAVACVLLFAFTF